MTDFEMTTICTRAIGDWPRRYFHTAFDPLHDDAHALMLVKRFKLHIDHRPGKQISVQDPDFEQIVIIEGICSTHANALNRAICECVAKMRPAEVG